MLAVVLFDESMMAPSLDFLNDIMRCLNIVGSCRTKEPFIDVCRFIAKTNAS